MPISCSVTNSGFRFLLPSVTGVLEPPDTLYVSYCAEKLGRLPAVPIE